MRFAFFIILTCTLLVNGCSQNEDIILHSDLKEFQGAWRDTLYSGRNVYIEDLFISGDTISYALTDANTLVTFDKINGFLILGNENKIAWSGISPLTNAMRQERWNVLDLSKYNMWLYSDLHGERIFKRVYYTSINEYLVQSTMSELLLYTKYLPLTKTNLMELFGTNNCLIGHNGITYLLNHPMFNKIIFKDNYDNDSIYSYILDVSSKYWNQIEQTINTQFTKIRAINGINEYCDALELQNSSFTICMDTINRLVAVSPLRDYDFWPNVSKYLGMQLYEVKTELEKQYVYICRHDYETGLIEYEFQTAKDSVCYNICVRTDDTNIVQSCSVMLFKQFMSSKKAAAQQEELKISALLSKRYMLTKEETDDLGNSVYHYLLCSPNKNSSFEIQLRLKYYKKGTSQLYGITIDYNLF